MKFSEHIGVILLLVGLGSVAFALLGRQSSLTLVSPVISENPTPTILPEVPEEEFSAWLPW